MSYYDWMHDTQSCGKCDWSGPGSEATMGEWFDSGAEYHCPKCDHRFGFIAYPLISETLSDPRADPADRKMIAIGEAMVERATKLALKSANQLPDLEPDPTTLIWDVIYGEGLGDDSFIVILDGDREIWREISFFEEYERFGEIATILWEKYGETLRDLEPTRGSWLNLGGDRLGSLGIVEAIRKSLGRGENPSSKD